MTIEASIDETPRCLTEGRTVLGECPTWDAAERALYWLDVMEGDIFRIEPASGALRRWSIKRKPHALALRQGGGMILTVRNGFWSFDQATGALEELRDAAPELPRNFVNDAKCDARGRLWAGSADRDLAPDKGELYRFDPDLTCRRMDTGISLSNGIAWSPDDRRMYYADTGAECIYLYDFDLAVGAATNRRIFAASADLPGKPDGITCDREGFVWSAQVDGGCLIRFAPDGTVERQVELPVSRPTSCQFGGDDLDMLFVTSASLEVSEAEKARQPQAGGLFAFRPGIAGLAPPRFAG